MATTTLTSNPNVYSPVYGNLWFQLTNSGYALNNFKYVYDLKKGNISGTAFTSLGRYKVPPSVSGYGLYDASRVLQTQLTYNITPTLSGCVVATNSNTAYKIDFGVEYNPNLSFTSTFATASKLGITFPTAHNLLVGDVIQISKDDKTVNYEYDGTASVVSVYGLSIDTNKNYLVSYTNETGVIISKLRMEGSSSVLNSFNGVRPYEDKNKDYGLTGSYLHNGSIREEGSTYSMTNYSFIDGWFPTYDGAKEVSYDDWETASYLVDNSGSKIITVGLQLYDADRLPYQNPNFNPAYFTFSYTGGKFAKRVDIGVGPQNLSAILSAESGDPSMYDIETLFADASYYMVCLQSADVGHATVPVSEFNSFGLRFFKIKEKDPLSNCSPYPKRRLAFINQLGGVDYFNFNFKSTNVMNNEKTFFKKELGWDYKVGDREDYVLSQKATETFTISSDFLTDKVAEWLKELIVSTEVYIIDNLGQKFPIIINDTSYQVKTRLNDKIFSVVINYRMAYQTNTAQG